MVDKAKKERARRRGVAEAKRLVGLLVGGLTAVMFLSVCIAGGWGAWVSFAGQQANPHQVRVEQVRHATLWNAATCLAAGVEVCADYPDAADVVANTATGAEMTLVGVQGGAAVLLVPDLLTLQPAEWQEVGKLLSGGVDSPDLTVGSTDVVYEQNGAVGVSSLAVGGVKSSMSWTYDGGEPRIVSITVTQTGESDE